MSPRLSLACMLLCSLASPGWAGPLGPDPAVAEENVDDLARDLFLEGEGHYAAGRYEQAADRFQRAHRLSGRPELLFNLANVYERLSDYERAAGYLRDYLQTPYVPDVASVRLRLSRLEEEAQRVTKESISVVQPEVDPTPLPPAPPRRGVSAPTIVMTSVSTLAGTTAIVLGGLTRQDRRSLSELCGTSAGGVLCQADARSLLLREKRRAVTTDIAAAVSVVSTVGLITHLGVRAGRRTSRPTTLTFTGNGLRIRHTL